EEWIEAADWLYRHWEILGGLSFLPKRETVYRLAPYEEISAEEYRRRAEELPEVDFSRILLYEREDSGRGAKEYACAGGACELDPEEGQFAGVPPPNP
ncbi:MAG: ribonucleoside-triphosphate reductase, partial [Deltaproteobacteria bacterium]|nr:ribonucleoside-triphosphate reductase [Deltaproteobacteria bacterium]